MARTVHDRCFECPKREFLVALEAVEEVLHVDEHLASVADEVLHRIGDHRDAFIERRLQGIEDVIVPALRNDAHGARACFDQVAQSRIIIDLALRTSSRTECDEGARREFQFTRGTGEELDVLRVRSWPTTFDVVHAEKVELFRNAQFVLDARRHTFHLKAVTKCRVEDFDHRAHRSLVSFMIGTRLAGFHRLGFVEFCSVVLSGNTKAALRAARAHEKNSRALANNDDGRDRTRYEARTGVDSVTIHRL